MSRYLRLMALCALVASLFALAAVTTASASEKSDVTKYARLKAKKELRRGGFSFSTSDITARCKDRGSYWSCSIEANGGQCNGKLRVYGSAGNFTAPKRYSAFGCVAD